MSGDEVSRIPGEESVEFGERQKGAQGGLVVRAEEIGLFHGCFFYESMTSAARRASGCQSRSERSCSLHGLKLVPIDDIGVTSALTSGNLRQR
jgi:hypothetical protein